MKMKRKKVISDERIRAVCILFEEFAAFSLFLEFEEDALKRVARVLEILPETVKRYLRESGFRPRYSKVLLGAGPDVKTTQKELFNYVEHVPEKTRAIVVLYRNGLKWKRIGKLLHLSADAVRKRFKRFIKDKRVQLYAELFQRISPNVKSPF